MKSDLGRCEDPSMRTREEKLEYARQYYKKNQGLQLLKSKEKRLADRRQIAAAIVAYEMLMKQESNGRQ